MSTLFSTGSASKPTKVSVWPIAALMSSMTYGATVTLFAFNFYLLLRRARQSSKQMIDRFLLGFITAQFLLLTVYISSSMQKTRLAFVVCRDYEGGPAVYQEHTLSHPGSIYGIAASILIHWTLDALLLWRCFAFNNGVSTRHLILSIPCLMYIGSVASGIAQIVLFTQDSGHPLHTLTFVYASSNAGFSVITTTTIIMRLYIKQRYIKKLSGPDATTSYTSVIAMLIESASPYIFFILFFLIPISMKSIYAVIPTLMDTQTQVIAPFMIIFRVAQGTTDFDFRDFGGMDAVTLERGNVEAISNIRFANPAQGQTADTTDTPEIHIKSHDGAGTSA